MIVVIEKLNGVDTYRRGFYHIRAYLSSIQYKNLSYRFVVDSSQMIWNRLTLGLEVNSVVKSTIYNNIQAPSISRLLCWLNEKNVCMR